MGMRNHVHCPDHLLHRLRNCQAIPRLQRRIKMSDSETLKIYKYEIDLLQGDGNTHYVEMPAAVSKILLWRFLAECATDR